MNFLKDIIRTVLGQNEDIYDYNQVDDSTILGHDDKNLQCEKQIIQCQITNDRLLGSTSASLRKKYGNDIVNRAIKRLSKRRIRGKCSRKAEIEKVLKVWKPVIDQYFKKSDESFSKGAL
tara:strand:+ start:67 stop:426 length:360 start_codon:yes stop_codon:yes gene_type:complete